MPDRHGPERQGPDPQETGERVQRLLDELTTMGDPEIVDRAEELVRALMELYGAGLTRVVELVAGSGDAALRDAMTADGLLGALLVLHDLHPQGVEERVRAALDEVRPYLGSHAGGVELLGLDDEGVVHLRLEGSCDGCPSSAVTVKYAIERAIDDSAPEVTGVHVEGLSEPDRTGSRAEPHLVPVESLLRPPAPSAGSGCTETSPRWTSAEGVGGLRPGELRPIEVDGAPVLICHAGGELYAYRNRCPACGAALDDGDLEGTQLSCGSCRTGYDVRLAGRGTVDAEVHLDPLPLLVDGDRIRIAAPVEVLR